MKVVNVTLGVVNYRSFEFLIRSGDTNEKNTKGDGSEEIDCGGT